MQETKKKIWEHWEEKARSSADYTATGPDANLRELEIINIAHFLNSGDFVIDFGCGTGYATAQYAKQVRKIVGIDFSPAMIEKAVKRYRHDNLQYMVGDILAPPSFEQKADIVTGTRCVINLESWEQQQKALSNMVNALRPGGHLLLMETFEEPFTECNRLRKILNIEPLERPWHNLFLDTKKTRGFLEKKFESVEIHSLGIYYLISRIVHPAYIHPEKPQYANNLNTIALTLAKEFGPTDILSGISPITLLAFKNKKNS